MDYVALGEKIRKKRKEMRFSLETLSSQVGISSGFLGMIERGNRQASVGTLVKIANALHLSMDTLLAESLSGALCPKEVSGQEWEQVLAILDILEKKAQ